jgi:hypothetical protein
VPEGANVEVAHHLSERGHHETESPHGRRDRLIEIAEVAILALVAIATAWSGFQAAKWDGRQSLLYGESSHDRFTADAESTAGGQELIGNLTLFTAWLQADASHNPELQSLLRRRMTPDYRVAFDAWLALDPLHNPKAPAGPALMPEYHNTRIEHADHLNAVASQKFEDGTHARENAEKYVRDTVLFAMVLFLVAIGQRFKAHAARVAVNVLAATVLVFTLVTVLTLPRL